MKEVTITDNYKNNLHVYIFDDVVLPKGVVQIVHGLNEHGLRYVEFSEYLNRQGYIVYINDHVSQGLSRKKDEEFVYFGKKGTNVLVDGLNTVRTLIQSAYKELPIYAFGHSMGTMILRSYLMNHENEYKKIILNGGGLADTKGLNFAIAIGNIINLFKPKKPSKFFDNIFRQTQYKLREKVEMNHFIEWLTRDKEKTEINLNDSFLYIRLTTSVFLDMLKTIKKINNVEAIKTFHLTNCPILVMSGTHDPSTNFGQDTLELSNVLSSYGFDSRCILYEEGRHDTIQEINRNDVFNDITSFMEESS